MSRQEYILQHILHLGTLNTLQVFLLADVVFVVQILYYVKLVPDVEYFIALCSVCIVNSFARIWTQLYQQVIKLRTYNWRFGYSLKIKSL